MKNHCDFSIVICAYNAEKRLPEVLDSLSNQVVSRNISWEIIVIDNNSNDKTSAIAKDYNEKIGDGSQLYVFFERTQGLIYARKRGCIEAKGVIISFLDDDNVVDPNYIDLTYSFFEDHPMVGVVGPKILPLMDYDPPPYFKYISQSLAIRDIGDITLNTTYSNYGHPPGAGMSCIRKLLIPILDREEFSLKGRSGDELSSGEDSLIAIEIRRYGYEWWYNPSVIIQHRIPESRLEISYVISLFRGMGMSSVATSEAIKGGKFTKYEHISKITRYLVRLFKYFIVSTFHFDKSKRQYAKFLVAMFLSGAKSHYGCLTGKMFK